MGNNHATANGVEDPESLRFLPVRQILGPDGRTAALGGTTDDHGIPVSTKPRRRSPVMQLLPRDRGVPESAQSEALIEPVQRSLSRRPTPILVAHDIGEQIGQQARHGHTTAFGNDLDLRRTSLGSDR